MITGRNAILFSSSMVLNTTFLKSLSDFTEEGFHNQLIYGSFTLSKFKMENGFTRSRYNSPCSFPPEVFDALKILHKKQKLAHILHSEPSTDVPISPSYLVGLFLRNDV